MMPWRRLCFLILAFAFSLAPSLAHGYVVRAIPADRSTLERPPARLQYWFSEDLEPRFSAIKLRDQSGAVIASGGVDETNRALLSLRAPPGLGDGAYIVELRPAFASDGHVIVESRVFFVGEEVGGVSGQRGDDRAIPLEIVWRAALNLANFVFFGATILYGVVLLPAWGGTRGDLPARVTGRLRNCLAAALALAIGASLVALLQQSMVFFDASALQVIRQNLWQVVLIGSRFGDVWVFRMVLLIFGAALLFAAEVFRAVTPQLSAGIWHGMPWLGALFIGLSMVTSHAAGSTLSPWLAIAVDWLHALIAAFWLGGALTLTVLLPSALAPLDDAAKRRARSAVMRRFSRIVAPLVALLIVSGLYNALNFFVTADDLATNYGRTLAIKLMMAAPVLLLGGWQAIALRPQLSARLGAALARLPARTGDWLKRAAVGGLALRLEVLLMLALLGAVAWLSATPVPEPASLPDQVETPRDRQIVGDYTIRMAIAPGGPGVNTYDAVIRHGSERAREAAVYLQLVNPARGVRSGWRRMELAEGDLYAAAGDEIDEAGEWQTLIDIVEPGGSWTRAATAWRISEAAAVRQTRAPALIHFVLLASLAVSLALLLRRRAMRLLSSLRLGSATALLAVGAVAVALGVMALGAREIGERQKAYEETLNPPPERVNTQLPDAESLRRGEALYREGCLVWQGHSADFRALRNRLGTARDDFLYGAVAAGWRDLPACEGELSAEERWDIVNYFRTFEARDN